MSARFPDSGLRTATVTTLDDISPQARGQLKSWLEPFFSRFAGGVAAGGTGVATFPGGSIASTAVTITHGLGRTPLAVVAGSGGSGSGVNNPPLAVAYNYTATTFDLEMVTIDGQTPANGSVANYSWIAL